jgi:hypothetical protein
MRKLVLTAAALGLAIGPMAGAASAQNRNVLNQQGGLVTVNVTNVDILTNFLNPDQLEILTDFANNNNVSVSAPITVQAPINVAAEVCGVDVNVLARGGPSRSTCSAEQGSQALADIVMRTIQTQ